MGLQGKNRSLSSSLTRLQAMLIVSVGDSWEGSGVLPGVGPGGGSSGAGGMGNRMSSLKL